MATISATGVIVPSAFDTWLIEAMRVRGVNSFSYSSRMIWPLLSTGATFRMAPFSAASCCQGTMLAWCSSQVMTISSPSLTLRPPHALAMRLMPSVVPRTKMMLSGDGALMNARTLERAAS